MTDARDPLESPDPTRMRNQAALTTSTGRSWLVLGGILAAISAGTLAFLVDLEPDGLAGFGIVAVVVLYAAMVVVRFRTQPGRRRLGVLAGLMIAIAAIGLGCVLLLALAGGAALNEVAA